MEILILATVLAGVVGLAVVLGNLAFVSSSRRPERVGASPGQSGLAPTDPDDDEDDGYVQFDVPPGVTRPPGEWEVFRDHQDVVGERYRMENALTFFRGVQEASARARTQETFELRYFGVELRREPGNPVDPKAVAVDGFWLRDPMVVTSQERVHLGYLPAGLAAHIADRLVPDAELGAELVGIDFDPNDEDDMLNVSIHVLNRPGDNIHPIRRR